MASGKSSLLKRMGVNPTEADNRFTQYEKAGITIQGDESGDQLPSVLEVLSRKMWTRLYTPVPGEDRVYTYSDVPDKNVENCLKKLGGRKHNSLNGKRLFYRESELPAGWRIPGQEDFPYQCPIDNCPKVLQTIQKLVGHVRGFHPTVWEFYKDELMEELKVEKEEQKAIRLKTIKRVVKNKQAARAQMAQREARLAELEALDGLSTDEEKTEEEDG